jgi:outer membrane receptor protein involved in Fe transport
MHALLSGMRLAISASVFNFQNIFSERSVMNRVVQQGQQINGQSVLSRAIKATLGKTAASVIVLGSSLLGTNLVLAQDTRSVDAIQTEVARLKQLLEQEEQALAQKTAASGAPSATAETKATASDDDEQLGKVTVRSRNRLEPLQDVPLSISVVTGKELERLQAVDISSITQRAANVSWNQGNQRTSSLSIRGVGKQGQTEAQDPSVGTIVDGVNYAYNALTSSFDFYDVDTVEVTRGPQGTLLGKNTSLGVVNITTRRPSFKPDAQFSLTYGEWNTVLGRAAVGGPVIDDLLAWRGTLTVNKGEGDFVNVNNRDLTWTNKERVYGRVQLLLTPTDTLSIRLAVDSAPHAGETTNGRTVNTRRPATYSNGTPWTGLDNPTRLNRRWFRQLGSYDVNGASYFDLDSEVNYDIARALETGSNGATLDVSWNLGSFDLTSITAYKDYHFNATNDDGTPFDVYRNAGGFWNDYKQWTQEFRLSSQVGGFVDYQTGLYFIKVHNTADYRREWANDAGAWFATDVQYARLDVDGDGRYLMQNSLDQLYMSFNSPAGVQDINNKSAAVFAQANWHFTPDFTLTTGARLTKEDRQNHAYSGIKDNGFAPELNPSIVNGVVLGGFDSYLNTGAARWVRNGLAVPVGTPGAVLVPAGTVAAPTVALTTDTTDAALLAQANAQANAAALKYFRVATWAALTDAQKRQLADAQAIRRTQIGVVFNPADAEPFKDTQTSFVVSPSYAINEQLSSYFSWQYGEKAGISQFVNGISSLIPGEETSSYEVGLKTTLLKKTLTFNTAVFLMDIKDYQQSVRILDEYTTANNIASGQAPNVATAYTSATGNVPKVQVKGVEVDGVYAGIPNTILRLAGAYNDARYKSFPTSAQPAENGYVGAAPYQDISGQTLPGAAKWAFNFAVDNRLPVFTDKEIRTSINAAYTSPNNTDNTLSIYGVVPSRTTVDAAISFGTRSGSFDIGLLVKNALDDDTRITNSSTGYTPAVPRWFGISVNGKL